MNRNDFMRMVENSGPADSMAVGEVSELISIFPYFQSAYMLLLKGLQNTADVRFKNQLRSYALFIADREVLYKFLNRETSPAEESPVTIPDDPVLDNETPDTLQVVIESAKNSEELIDEIEKDITGEGTGDKEGEYSILVTSESGNKDSDATIVIINEESGDVEERVVYMDPGF
jgi:hypothetical protein